MSQQEIQSEMRLWALEAFVCEIFSLWCAQQDDPGRVYASLRKRLKTAAKQPRGGSDPALSDHLSGVLEDAVDRLMDIGRRQLKAHLKPSQMRKFADESGNDA
jgi:hypothetical protein